MTYFADIWQDSTASERLAAFGGALTGTFPGMLTQTRLRLEEALTQLTMPLEQDYAALLAFQENYKDLRRELDFVLELQAMLQETEQLMRASAE